MQRAGGVLVVQEGAELSQVSFVSGKQIGEWHADELALCARTETEMRRISH
jgi:hypothetical protein